MAEFRRPVMRFDLRSMGIWVQSKRGDEFETDFLPVRVGICGSMCIEIANGATDRVRDAILGMDTANNARDVAGQISS